MSDKCTSTSAKSDLQLVSFIRHEKQSWLIVQIPSGTGSGMIGIFRLPLHCRLQMPPRKRRADIDWPDSFLTEEGGFTFSWAGLACFYDNARFDDTTFPEADLPGTAGFVLLQSGDLSSAAVPGTCDERGLRVAKQPVRSERKEDQGKRDAKKWATRLREPLKCFDENRGS